jgi:hypothetical protein
MRRALRAMPDWTIARDVPRKLYSNINILNDVTGRAGRCGIAGSGKFCRDEPANRHGSPPSERPGGEAGPGLRQAGPLAAKGTNFIAMPFMQ